jgi:hypothetical protein
MTDSDLTETARALRELLNRRRPYGTPPVMDVLELTATELAERVARQLTEALLDCGVDAGVLLAADFDLLQPDERIFAVREAAGQLWAEANRTYRKPLASAEKQMDQRTLLVERIGEATPSDSQLRQLEGFAKQIETLQESAKPLFAPMLTARAAEEYSRALPLRERGEDELTQLRNWDETNILQLLDGILFTNIWRDGAPDFLDGIAPYIAAR